MSFTEVTKQQIKHYIIFFDPLSVLCFFTNIKLEHPTTFLILLKYLPTSGLLGQRLVTPRAPPVALSYSLRLRRS